MTPLLNILKRGLLIGVLSLLSTAQTAFGIELKISIQPDSPKEYFITVNTDNGINGITKETINHETTFDVEPGFITVEIGKKKIKKFITRPSILQIYYSD